MPADQVPVTAIMSRNVISARVNTPVSALMHLMSSHQTSCVPIVDDRCQPIGIVTKSDVVEFVEHAQGTDLSLRTAAEIMMPLAITLHEHATVAHVANMIATEGFHHVMIVGPDGAL